MSEEEIKALAAELGLDPTKLRLFERRQFEDKGMIYRFEYDTGAKVLDYNFCLGDDEIVSGYEAKGVQFYVDRGLRELAEKINA